MSICDLILKEIENERGLKFPFRLKDEYYNLVKENFLEIKLKLLSYNFVLINNKVLNLDNDEPYFYFTINKI